jgi:hypothetical protein
VRFERHFGLLTLIEYSQTFIVKQRANYFLRRQYTAIKRSAKLPAQAPLIHSNVDGNEREVVGFGSFAEPDPETESGDHPGF